LITKLVFYLAYNLAKLPFSFLYLISDILYGIFLLIGYRKKVILTNINIAFPEKSNEEKCLIRRKFYKNFSQYLVESVKSLTVNPAIIQNEKTRLFGLDILQDCYKKDKEVFLLMPHVFNWDWIGFWATSCPQKNVYAINKALKNKFMDKKMDEARFRVGGKGLKTRNVYKFISEEKHNKDNIYLFLVDQSPNMNFVKLKIPFFGKDTAVFNGYDSLIKKRNAEVIYCDTRKIGKGIYEYHFKKIEPDNEEFVENEVVIKFFSLLENSIKKNPDNWLWSHKRWKEDVKK